MKIKPVVTNCIHTSHGASVSEQMQAYIETKDCKYRKSAEKICYMMRRFEEDGFTSYWL